MYQSLCYSKWLRISRETPKKICSIFELTISMFVRNKLQCISTSDRNRCKKIDLCVALSKKHTSQDCSSPKIVYVVRKTHLSKNGKTSNIIQDNECDDCKKDCKIVTIRTRFGFWY